MERARVDRWLWAVRVYPSRSEATDGCRGGHVRINGAPAKAATSVRIGDRVTVQMIGRQRIVEVARVIEKRVGPQVAAECMVDHTPPPPPREFVAPAFVRDPSTGRPTKKERRDLDRVRKV